MLLGIDHLVIAVADPDAAAAELAAVLGLAFTGGGRHERAGTHNRLAFCGDSYLELIGVWDRTLAAANPIGAAALRALDADREGLITFALATDDVRADVDPLVGRASPIGAPQPGERVREDGEAVRWLTAVPPRLGPEEPPFLIEHEPIGAEWGDAARRARSRFEHPIGGRVRLVGLELAVGDPALVAAAYRLAVGLAMAPAAGAMPGEHEGRVGGQAIRLVRPGADLPAARVGLRGSTPGRILADRCGVRIALL